MRLLLISLCFVILVLVFGCSKELSDDPKINFIKTFQKYDGTGRKNFVMDWVESVEKGETSWSESDSTLRIGGFSKETQNAYQKWRSHAKKYKFNLK
jgi:hypothetical protein